MFSGFKAYAAGIGAAVVLAIVGYLLYTHHSGQKEKEALQKEVTTTKIENQDLKQTVEVSQKASEITSEAVVHHAQEVKQVEQSFDKVEQETARKIAEINRQAPATTPIPGTPPAPTEELAALPALPTPKEQQISQVRIAALWSGFCLAAPEDTQCKETR